MLIDRNTRSFFAVSLLLIGVVIAINALLRPEGLADWAGLAAFAALAGAVALWVTLWLEDRAAEQADAAPLSISGAPALPVAQEWIISKELPAPTHHDNAASAAAHILVEEDSPAEADDVISATVMEAAPPAVREEAAPVIESVAEAEEDVPVEIAGDDLQRIEGIGPAYSEALRNAGIHTFAQLATAPREALETALRAGGYPRIPASIATWAEQAALAAEGKWTELDTLQEHLTAGRR
jgi:predicted flap endonuclease-1-like 5' DNA nuclease